MESTQESRPVPTSHAPPDRDQAASGDRRPAWRAPVVTRLRVDRTLFFVNSHTDLGSNGSTIG